MKKIITILLILFSLSSFGQQRTAFYTVEDTSFTLVRNMPLHTVYLITSFNNFYISDTLFTSGTTLGHWYSNGHLKMIPKDSTYWDRANGHIYPKTITDSVGIGTNSPNKLFEVNGSSLFKDTIYLSSNQYVYGETPSELVIQSKGVTLKLLSAHSSYLGSEILDSLSNGDMWKKDKYGRISHFYNGNPYVGYLFFPNVTSSDKQWNLPDTSGTIALNSYVQSIVDDSVLFTKSGNYIYPKTITDSVGIGTKTPSSQFEVKNLFENSSINRNLYIGDSAGYSSTSTDNVFIGYNAGKSITNKQGVVIGANAGKLATTANKGVIIGESAGYYNQGNANNFIGRKAGEFNISGIQNQFIGKEAGRYNIDGSYNLAVGTQSLRYDTSGDYNVALGNDVLQTTYNSQRNIGIGYSSLEGGGYTFVDNFAAGYETGHYNGNGANDNIFIGNQSGYNNIGSHNIFQGYRTGHSNTSGSKNIFQGYYSGFNNTIGSYNIFQGYYSGLSNTTGGYNIFQGYYSGFSNTIGNYNIFQGYTSGFHNTTGYDNIFIGHNAGESNTTGYQNVFIGRGAGDSNTTARWNVFIGFSSGNSNTTGTNNMFLGGYTGNSNTTGNNNTLLGYEAGIHNETASNNTYVGTAAGISNKTGTSNVCVGYQAGYSDTLSNNVFIGNQAGHNVIGGGNVMIGNEAGFYDATASNKLYIDNSSTSTPLIYGEFDNDYLRFNADSTRFNGIVYADTVHSHAFVGMSDFSIGKDGENTSILSDSLFIGDTATGNYTLITDNGTTRYGIARHIRSKEISSYEMRGNRGKYNGVRYNSAGKSTVANLYYFKRFNKDIKVKNTAAITNFAMPDDYDDSSRVILIIHWTTANTIGFVKFNIGIASTSEGGDMNHPNYEWYHVNPTVKPNPYEMSSVVIDIPKPLIRSGDEVGIVICRNGDNDSLVGDALVSSITIKYTSNK